MVIFRYNGKMKQCNTDNVRTYPRMIYQKRYKENGLGLSSPTWNRHGLTKHDHACILNSIDLSLCYYQYMRYIYVQLRNGAIQ